MIQLYGIPASRAFRSLWMLEELGVPYENVPTHYATDAKKPEYLRINPNGRIPALVDDDGTTVWESMAINLYLAEKYGRDLYPRDAAGRAHALQWSIFAMTEIEPPALEILRHRRELPEAQRDPAAAAAAVEKLRQPLGVLEGALDGHEFLIGDRFTVADLNVAAVLFWAPRIGRVDLSPWPRVQRWFEACFGRPAVKRAQGRR
jgi:glutathione S-transferase